MNYKTYIYDVYDNNTDMPIIIGGSAKECARVLGIKTESFKCYEGKSKSGRYTVIRYKPCEVGDTFAARLTGARRAAKLTLVELANMVGISAIAIRKYENGEHIPNIETANRLAKALGVSIRYLAGEKRENKMIISKKKFKHLEESVTHLSNENIKLKHEKAQIMAEVDELINTTHALIGAVILASGKEVVEVTTGEIKGFVGQKKCLVEYEENGYKLRVVDSDEADG